MYCAATPAHRCRSPTTPAATGIARSVRRARRAGGWRRGRPTCCRSTTTTSSSPCRHRSAPSPTTTRRVIYDLLFAVAAETLRTIAADPKHLGAQVGVTLVLHTWGSALTHHPHVHGIVPGGGLAPDGERWVACKPGFFLSVRVLSRLFRRRFLEELEPRIAPAGCSSSASTPNSPTRARSPPGSRRCAQWNGSSMPSAPSPGRRRCSPICRVTPTGWPSPTAACSPWTSAASPSAGRTTGPRAARATRP